MNCCNVYQFLKEYATLPTISLNNMNAIGIKQTNKYNTEIKPLSNIMPII